MAPQEIIARRMAQELAPGMLVNLGIGIPTQVANYLPEGMHVFFQSENGLIGTGAPPEEGMAHPTLTDAGGRPVTALPGASTFDSAISFGLIRGGHLDFTVLAGCRSISKDTSRTGRSRKDGAGYGRGNGSRLRGKARHRGHAAHREGRLQDREKMFAARHILTPRRTGRHRAGGHRIRGRPSDLARDRARENGGSGRRGD